MNILVAAQDYGILSDLIPALKSYRFEEDVNVCVIHVVQMPPYGYFADLDVQKHVLDGAKKVVDSLVADIKEALPFLSVDGMVVEGDPKEEIVKVARTSLARLIIMGSHGRGPVGRFLLGSVSLAVHASAPCSVLVLRPTTAEPPSVVSQSQEQVLQR